MYLRPMVDRNRAIFTDSSNDTENLNIYVQEDNYVFIKDRPGIDHLIYRDYLYRKTIKTSDRDHCPFAIAKTPFMTRKRSFAYTKGFPYKDLFDPE